MQPSNSRPRFDVAADAHGLCGHAGVVLLAELADRLALTSELGRRANLGLVRPGGSLAYDRGAVLRDLVVMLADGGDCLSDLGQPAGAGWAVRQGVLDADRVAGGPRGRLRPQGGGGGVVGAGAGPPAGVGGGRGASGAAAAGP